MVRVIFNIAKMKREVVVLIYMAMGAIIFSIVAAGNLRSSRETTNHSGLSIVWERMLPELKEVQSEYESLKARSRHRSDPREHNIFLHDVETAPTLSEVSSALPSLQMTTSPSEMPSALPSINEETSFPSRIPSSFPSSIPTVQQSSSPSSSPTLLPSVSPSTSVPTVLPTNIYPPTITESPNSGYDDSNAPFSIETDDELDKTNSPSSGNSNNDGIDTSKPTINFTASSIDDFLNQTVSNNGEIYDVGSPQNDALIALLDSSSTLDPNNSNDRIEILQRYALNTLYFSTDGENWVFNDLWTSASNPCGIKSENNDIEGAWFGILCDSDLKVVEKVSLDNNGLRGGLPSDIRGLSSLKRLEISNNQLSGSLAETIGELTDMSVLDIGTNFFTGSIPQSIGNMKSLLLLDVSSNFLSGTLAVDIGQLTTLLSLSAESNFLMGSLTSELFSITPLISLDIGSNQFTGTFPSEIGQLSNAVSLSFSSNSLSGIIPDEIRTLQKLENFDASSNFIGAQLPDVFDELFYLKNFDMALNYLSGTIPETLLFNTTVLNTLNISGNILGLEDSLPEGLGRMTSLRSLDLSTNQFIGTIPESIGGMRNLIDLRLDRNFLTGQVPTSVNQLSNMKILSLSENSLSNFPTELISLSKLEELQLSTNSFNEIPNELFNDFENLEVLNVSRNEIDGTKFPSQIKSTTLKSVDFSFNNLHASFNISSLLGLVNVQNLHMASCSIQSSIPDDINVLQSLITLNFDGNELSGTIPSTLGEINSLERILFADNDLTGTIPSKLAQLQNLRMLELQSNFLSGNIPNEFELLTELHFNYSGNLISD